ncbi:MAG: DnaD domain protein, partial [Anaerolineaceae bacterium]|nr:DnaD domain protein [Anaerolineaceae bacterium]
FTKLLAEIDSLVELKVILYSFWFLDHQEGSIRYIKYQDFISDGEFMRGLGSEAVEKLGMGLERSTQRGVLLKASTADTDLEETLYFLNSPRGRAAVKSYQQGTWSPHRDDQIPAALENERPNIYRLYEENIGPLTPLIADTLRDAEETYASDWIEDAIRIAVQKNVRNWRYIEAILKSWLKEGRYEQSRKNDEEDRRRYIEGEYGDLIEH